MQVTEVDSLQVLEIKVRIHELNPTPNDASVPYPLQHGFTLYAYWRQTSISKPREHRVSRNCFRTLSARGSYLANR